MKYDHSGMTYDNPEIDSRREWSGQAVRGGADAARRRMMNRDIERRRLVEREAAERQAALNAKRAKPSKLAENIRRGMDDDLKRYGRDEGE